MLSREFLTNPWIERQIAGHLAAESLMGKMEKVLTEGFLTSIGASEWEAEWGARLRSTMQWCELEYLQGTASTTIREHCRKIVEAFLLETNKLDFSPKKCRVDGGMLPSVAKKLAEMHGGKWWKSSQHHAGAEWTEMNQPLCLDIKRLWALAAVAGDQGLAHQLAISYLIPESCSLRAEDKYLIREYVLRHALANDREAEVKLVKMLLPGYMAGLPQDLIEFPLAINSGDIELLRRAMKKTTATFKGKWDVKRMRNWYDKRAHRRSIGTWEQVIDGTKRELLSCQWVFSWWALSWLNIARWRGMISIFEEHKLFSEWVPISLCST